DRLGWIDQAIDSPCHTTNAASAVKNKAPSPETRTGRTTQPIAATKTAAAPIQKSRPWLEPLPKKSAAKASPPAAAPPTAGQRIQGPRCRRPRSRQGGSSLDQRLFEGADPRLVRRRPR